MSLFRWKTPDPKTPFAPNWDVPILSDVFPVDKNWIQEDLGDWKSYNIFNQGVYNTLLGIIKHACYEFADELRYKLPDNLWIRGWMNVMNEGEELNLHSHSYHENTFLSGNMLLNSSSVSTEYIIPNFSTYNGTFKPNPIEGNLVLFPSWVEHFVPKVNKKRYCAAWDLYTNESMEYMRDNKLDSQMELAIPFE